MLCVGLVVNPLMVPLWKCGLKTLDIHMRRGWDDAAWVQLALYDRVFLMRRTSSGCQVFGSATYISDIQLTFAQCGMLVDQHLMSPLQMLSSFGEFNVLYGLNLQSFIRLSPELLIEHKSLTTLLQVFLA